MGKNLNRVLITGGAGFIGSNLALNLIEKGYIVTVLDNLSEQVHGNDPINTSHLYNKIKGKVNFILGSVNNRSDWEKAILNQDAIIHLAAETGTGQSMYQIQKYTDVNIGGTATMLDILTNNKHTIKKLITASSRAVYGEGKYECLEHGVVYPMTRKEEDLSQGIFECKCPICNGKVTLLPTSENSEINPSSIYGITKFTQEQMALTVGESLKIPTIALRFQNVYGPGQSLTNPYTGILSIFSTRIKNGKDINIFEDGLESRDFVYIDDIVDSINICLETNKGSYQAYNVGADKPISVIEVAETLKKEYNSDIKIYVSGNYRLGDIRHNYADLSAIKLLGYSPKIKFKQGISLFCNWVNSQNICADKYDDSIKEMKEKGLYK